MSLDWKLGADEFGGKESREGEYNSRESKWKDKGSWDDGACVDWSAIPRAAVKQNPNIKCCHCRFRCSMFCLATTGTGVTGGDSRSMVFEGCGCVGGE